MAINQKSDVKSDESILGKAYNGYINSIFYYYYSSDPYIYVCVLVYISTHIHPYISKSRLVIES